jgi:peptide/nickel transport system permease protein
VTAYILRRLLHAALVVLLVSMLVFIVMRLLPGDPILMYVTAADMQSSSTEQVAALKRELGLDRPLVIQ